MENESIEPTEVEVTVVENAEIVYQQDKAQIDVQISTAKAYPRNIQRATNNAMAIVTMDKETAATCTYSVPRGGKQISGPSVHLAKILAQVWGNLRVEAKVVDIGQRQITSQATAFDLENNLAIKVEVKRSIWGKYGRFNDDMITVTGNAANAIALRNAILNVIPRAIVDKIYNSAKHTITGDVSDEAKLIAKRKQVFEALQNTYDVTEAEILTSIGKAALTHVNSDDIVTLIGFGQAIKDGDTTVENVFKGKKDAQKEEIILEDLVKLYEEKKVLLSEKEIKDADRIIKGKEVLSYTKLFNLLNSKDVNNEK